MTEIDAKTVMQLRRQTGAPMMDCKAALQETKGDMASAVDVLRKRGLKAAENRSAREATQGRIFSYIHHNHRLGVLVEVACETDFVARNEEFERFGRELCLHIAGASPPALHLSRESVDPAALAKEREIAAAQVAETMAGKPKDVMDKAVEGKVARYLAETCLLEQPWVHDSSGKTTVETAVKALAGKIGENIYVRRFVRLELGG